MRIFLILVSCVFPALSVFAEETVEGVVSIDGMERVYLEVVPDRGRQLPLVVLLHGGAQSMNKVLEPGRVTSRWIDKAHEEDFVLLVPNGTHVRTGSGRGDRQRWNDFRSFSGDGSVDDAAFLLALIESKIETGVVDSDRVYLVGSSNGGMMTYRMLSMHPEVFAAGVSLIANVPGETPVPASNVPIMIVLGDEDRLMPFDGGSILRNRGSVLSYEATLEYWKTGLGLEDVYPVVTPLPDVAIDDGCQMSRWDWGSSVPLLSFVLMEGGGHTIPTLSPVVSSGVVRHLFGNTCQDVESVDLIWSFLSHHKG